MNESDKDRERERGGATGGQMERVQKEGAKRKKGNVRHTSNTHEQNANSHCIRLTLSGII